MTTLSSYAKQLIDHVHGIASLDASERSRAMDPLIRPFGTLAAQKAELVPLKKSTMDAVYAMKRNSDVVLVPIDPDAFEKLSYRIETLEAKVAHNDGVLTRLDAECTKLGLKEYSLNVLTSRREAIDREIAGILKEPDYALSHLFNAAAQLGNRSDAEKHPDVLAARKAAEAKTVPLKGEALDLDEKIATIQAILREFQM